MTAKEKLKITLLNPKLGKAASLEFMRANKTGTNAVITMYDGTKVTYRHVYESLKR
jgi:hypothetical protein